MSMNRASMDAYKKVAVDSQLNTASPHKVIAILFQGAIERLYQGKVAMSQDNLQLKGERLNKALNIIISLKGSLSHEDGGDIASNLDALYDYMIRRVSDANTYNQQEPLDEVINMIREIKSAWDQIPEAFHHLSAAS